MASLHYFQRKHQLLEWQQTNKVTSGLQPSKDSSFCSSTEGASTEYTEYWLLDRQHFIKWH